MKILFGVILLLTLILLNFVSFIFTIEFEKKTEIQRRKSVRVFTAILIVCIFYPLIFFPGYYKFFALLSIMAFAAMFSYEKDLRKLIL